MEDIFGEALNPSEDKADDTALRQFLEAARDGRNPPENWDPDVAFYILGLAPNASRLAVRFWHVSSVEEMRLRIGRHFSHLNIVRQYDSDPEFPPLWRLLRETAAQGKSDNIPPLLAGAVTRAIFTGGPYPQAMLGSVIMRIRADHRVNYLRAAMLKAHLIRNLNREVNVTLDPEYTGQPYVLGRLFAILERAQEEAVPGSNTTIKDRYFGAAAATPKRVFPVLIKGAQNHVSKLRKDPESRGLAIWLEKLIAEIIDKFSANDMRPALPLEDQAEFAIGYYHQRKHLFTKKETTEKAQPEAKEEKE